jgi:hypothetical protein
MKHKLIIFFFFFLLHTGYSQDYKVAWTEEEKGDKLPQFAATNSKGEIITIGIKKLGKKIKKLKIKKFDKNLRLLESIEQKEWESSSWKAKDYVLDGLITLNDKIYCVLYKKVKKQYFVYKVELKKDLRISDKIDEIGVFNHTNRKLNLSTTNHTDFLLPTVNNKLRYDISSDKSKLILYNYYDLEKQKHITIYCYDNNFEKLWTKDINLKIYEKDVKITNTAVSDQGNIYINYEKTTQKGIFGGTIDYENFVLQIGDNGESVKNIDLNISANYHVNKVQISNNEFTGTLNVMGFYSNKKSRTSINGIINVVIDEKTLELKAKNITKFTDEEYKYFYNNEKKAEKKADKDKGIPNDLVMIGQYALSDGGTIYLSEIFKVIVTTYNNGKTTSTRYEYIYGDIFIVKTDLNGDIEWTKILKRYQSTTNYKMLTYYGSYSFLLDDKVYLLYNDSEKNIELQEEKESKKNKKNSVKGTGNIKKAMAVLKIIDPEGDIKSNVVLDGKEEDVIFNTNYSLKLNEQQLLLFANKKKLTKVGVLTVKQLDVPLKYNPSKVKASETATKPEGIIQKVAEKSVDPNGTGIDKSTETNPMEPSTNTSMPAIENKVAPSSSTTTPEAKTPPAEAPKPVYTPSSVSPGRKATDAEQDFFNKLREQQPAAEPAK